MERRNFIKSTCNICLLGAAGIFSIQLPGCSPASFPIYKTGVTDKKVLVPLSLFDKTSFQLVRPKNMFYDIAVQKEDNSYTALLLLCTHQQNQLAISGSGYTCTLHGSQFDKNGDVRRGPAEIPLQRFKTNVSNDNLIIQIQ